MITITLKFSKEVEQELEKDFSYLEKITKKPREYHFKEALVRYIKEIEWEAGKNIKKKTSSPEELEIVWNKINETPPEHHFKEALVRYIEDMEDIRDVEKIKKEDNKKGKSKLYTSEEADKRLKELRVKNVQKR